MNDNKLPFWKTKTFAQMSKQQWEQLCDGCGLCCLHKLENADTGQVSYTDVACRLLDIKTCRCKKYTQRKKLVPDCVILKPEDISRFKWLPRTCAYRLISEGKDLYPWHPLVSNSDHSIHSNNISVKDKVISERDAGDLEDHIIDISEISHE